MAATAFVQMVLSSVCLQASQPSQAAVDGLNSQQQRALYDMACDTTNRELRIHDGQLMNWTRKVNISSLQGRTLRLAVKQLPTADYLDSELEPDRWSFRVIDILSTIYGFTAEYVPAEQASGGVSGPAAGDWTGITGQLTRGEVDMTGNFLAATSQRINLVSFGETLGHSQIGLLIRKPRAETRNDSLLAPFDAEVWLLVVISMIVMGPVIWIIIRFRVWLAPGDKNLNRIIPLGSCVWFVYGGLMKQGTVLSPITDSSRLLFATWWIFITVVTAFYTANLTAYMTFSSMKIPIQNVRELSASEKHWLAPAGDSIQMFTESSEQLMRMKRGGRGSYLSRDHPPRQILDRVRGGGYVYIDEVSRLNALMMSDYYASNNTCHVHVVPLKDQYLKLALASPKDSAINEALDPFVHWLVMTGIARKWMQDAAVDSAPCTTSSSIKSTKLKNEELRMVYYIMLIAYGCSTVLLLLELALAWLARRCLGGGRREQQLTERQAEALSVLRRTLQPSGGAKQAWLKPAGGSTGTWASVFVGAPRTPPTQSPPPPPPEPTAAEPRSDSEVLREMRANMKTINGRPYLFLKLGGAVRPVPVTEDKNELLETIFQELKRRPRDSRLTEQFGDLYAGQRFSR